MNTPIIWPSLASSSLESGVDVRLMTSPVARAFHSWWLPGLVHCWDEMYVQRSRWPQLWWGSTDGVLVFNGEVGGAIGDCERTG